MASWSRALGVFVVSLAAACSSSSGSSVGPATDAGTESVTPSSPLEICSMYVTCVSHADPAGLGEVLAAYGPDGTCWTNSSTTSICQQACIAGIAQTREDDSFAGACPMCMTDGDCALAGNAEPKIGSGKLGEPSGPTSTPVCSAGTCVCAPMAHSCAADGDCCSGDCAANICTCPAGTLACDGACLDVTSDDENCGGCGKVCPGGSSCTKGACDCSGYGVGYVACGDECSDVSSDSDNCGACGNACTGQTTTCSSGVCSCQYGEAFCNGACIDVTQDPGNCGACGATCPSGTMCMGDGSCGVTLTNPDSEITCDSACSAVSASCSGASFEFTGCDASFTIPTCSETVDTIEQGDLSECFNPSIVATLNCECGAAKAP